MKIDKLVDDISCKVTQIETNFIQSKRKWYKVRDVVKRYLIWKLAEGSRKMSRTWVSQAYFV